jgi:hypothetical protein
MIFDALEVNLSSVYAVLACFGQKKSPDSTSEQWSG